MVNLYQIVLTSTFTIIGGVIIYVVGQIIERFFIDPIGKQKETIGDIADMLIFNANLYSNPFHFAVVSHDKRDEKMQQWKDASEKTRKLSSVLNSRTFQIPCYSILEEMQIVLPKKDIGESCSQLIGLSNSYINSGLPSGNTHLAGIKCRKSEQSGLASVTRLFTRGVPRSGVRIDWWRRQRLRLYVC